MFTINKVNGNHQSEDDGPGQEKSQLQQKSWYNKNARERHFEPGDMVLLLLPTSSSKLLAQWQGPYRVEKKVSRVDYLIQMPQRRKKKQIFHIKKWESRAEDVAVCMEEGEDDDFPEWRGSCEPQPQPMFGEQLTEKQKKELEEIMDEFADVLRGRPGQTHVAEQYPH